MHPHRGIETITYLIEGSFRHRDSRGGGGTLNSGDVQWMTAGKGIQHEEMPAMENGRLWGYQLWLNLPRKFKWVEPQYQHLGKEDIPVKENSGSKVLVISGNFEGVSGPAQNYVPSEYYDVYLEKGESIQLKTEKGYNSIIFVHSGSIEIAHNEIQNGNLVELSENNLISIFSPDRRAGFLFLSAKPNV